MLLLCIGALVVLVASVPRSPEYHLRIPDFLFGPPSGRTAAVHPDQLPGYGTLVNDVPTWVLTSDSEVPKGAIRILLLAPHYAGFWGPTRSVRPLVIENDTSLTPAQHDALRMSILETVQPDSSGTARILEVLRSNRSTLVSREPGGYVLNTLTCMVLVGTLAAAVYFGAACVGAVRSAR